MKTRSDAGRELYEILLDAVNDGKHGDYELCIAIVGAFREARGEEAAKRARRILWDMIKETE